MAQQWVFEGEPELWTEVVREGKALLRIAQLTQDEGFPNAVYVRFCSWREDGQGHEVDQLAGKRVRITIEVVDG